MSDLVTKINALEKEMAKTYKSIDEVRGYLQNLESRLHDAFMQAARTFNATVDEDDLKIFIEEFIKAPYFVLPKKQNEWWLVVPRFITLEFGFLIAQEGAWNIFVVNKYVAMIQEVPIELREEIDLSTPFNGIVIEDGLLHVLEPDRDDVVEVKSRYKKYLGRIMDTATIQIKKGFEFEAMAALIRDGILPYRPVPVPKTLIRKKEPKFKLREYQKQDRDVVLSDGAAGIFYPMGGGKSFVGLDLISRLKGRKLVLVPNATLREHWKEYIDKYLDVDPQEVEIYIYHRDNAPKVSKEKWSLIIFDEVATLPADTHLQFANLEAYARVFMTGVPTRSDGREDLIFALCRNPRGVNWRYFLENDLVRFPLINVWIDRNEQAKLKRLDLLLDPEKQTMIFVDKLKYGAMLAKRYDIPFIQGSTKHDQRLALMRENKWVVVSRIADFGVSLKQLEMVIEADINWASEGQATQRAGRLFHTEEEGTYHGLMTAESWVKVKDRYLLMFSKGLKIKVHQAEDLPADLAAFVKQQRSRTRVGPEKVKPIPKAKERTQVDTSEYPLIDERAELSTDLLKQVLGSEFSKKNGGLFVNQVRDVLRFNRIKGHDTRLVSDILWQLWDAKKIDGRTEANKRRYFPRGGFGR